MRKPIELTFRALLLLYPREFRAAFGADMASLFSRRLDDADAAGERGRFVLRTIISVAAAAAAERLTRRYSRRRASSRGRRIMSGFTQDVRYAVRLLRRQPAVSLFIVLTLAVGIGANTAVFTVVNGVLLRPLPFAESERLVAVWGRFDPESGFDFPQFPLSIPELLDYRQHTRALEDVAAFSTRSATIGGPDAEPERVQTALVTPNLFAVLRASPALGRTFSDEEGRPNGPRVVVLAHGYWQTRFGGDPAVLGRTVLVDGFSATVVGVMPAGFRYPQVATRLWAPLQIDAANPGNRKGHMIRAVGRLAAGMTIATARAELHGQMQDWKSRFPDIHTGHYLFIRPMIEDVTGSVRPALALLLAATAFVLLIVCANVASLMLARGESRLREMAIRGALGAERGRLLRLTLVEGSLLAFIGGTVGLLLGYAAMRTLITIDPASIPRADELRLDATMMVWTLGVSLVSALLFGIVPAIRGARPELQGTLKDVATTASGGPGRQWFRSALVLGEVALSVLLVLGAGLMLRSFARLTSVDPGFRAEGLVTASVSLPPGAYEDAARVETFYDGLLERVRSYPGIQAISAGTTVPLMRDLGVWDFEIEGRPRPTAGQQAWNAKVTMVRPGYFETLEIPLISGRSFTDRDDERSMPVAIVSRLLVEKFLAGEDPIGRRIRVSGDGTRWMTIVGVVGDIHQEDLAAVPRPAYYLAHAQAFTTIQSIPRTMALFARTSGDPAPVMAAIRSAVRELDPSLAVYDVQSLGSLLDRSVARPRFTTLLLAVFAGVGVMLGASGIYGVLAYAVARRTHEIGIRRALGAPALPLATSVIGWGMLPVCAGIVLGLTASYWTTRWWSSELFQVSPLDPAVYAASAAAALLVAVAATLVPLHRALRVSPLVALRSS